MKRISSIILTCALIILYAVTSGDVTTYASTINEATETNLTAGVTKDLTPVSQQVETSTTLYAGVSQFLSSANVLPKKVNITAGVTADIYGGLVEVASVSENNVDVVAASYEDDTIIDNETNIIMGEIILEDNNTETTEEVETTEDTTEVAETMNTTEPGRTETGAYIVTGRSFNTLEEWEFDLLCHLVTGEACGETDQAQIAVAQVVLNRMESSHFPNSLYDVIYQKNPVQFSPTVDGNINKTPDERCIANVKTALTDVFYPKEMLFFTSTGYTRGYTDYLKIDDMYFSLCYN